MEFKDPGEVLPPAAPSPDTLRLMAERRSVPALLLAEPGPGKAVLDEILTLAARVPDHRMLEPFRFLVIEKSARPRFADRVRKAAAQRQEATDPAKVLTLIAGAPAMVVLISSVDPGHKTPVWEQELTAGAAGQNLLIAAAAAGFGAQWLTGWMAYDAAIGDALRLSANERVAGFFYFGTPKEAPTERRRPDLDAIRRSWEG